MAARMKSIRDNYDGITIYRNFEGEEIILSSDSLRFSTLRIGFDLKQLEEIALELSK